MMVRNQDKRAGDYDEMRTKYRPSHADYTYQAKFGIRAWQGGGRASARETVGRVAAGAVARKVLAAAAPERRDRRLGASGCGPGGARRPPPRSTRDAVDANIVRCPDAAMAEQMIALIDEARKAGDSLGGVVEAVARGVPAGLGEPVFDKLDADLAKAMLSLPGGKGFEIGSGFAGTLLTGSQHNDPFYDAGGPVRTRTNRSGGVQGGISNGEDIFLRVAFKPTATILREQETVDEDGNDTTIKGRGRHDPCVLPRAVPIVEAMIALVLADHFCGSAGSAASRAARPFRGWPRPACWRGCRARRRPAAPLSGGRVGAGRPCRRRTRTRSTSRSPRPTR